MILGVTDDFAVAEPQELLGVMAEIAGRRPQVITIFCTDLHAAPLVDAVEARLDIPLLNMVGPTVWGALGAAGADPGVGEGWGRLFDWH